MKRWLLIAFALLCPIVMGQVTVSTGVSAIGTTTSNTWTAQQTFSSGAASNQFGTTGTTFTLSGGTGACGTTTTLTGGSSVGSFLCTGTAGASTIVVTLPTSAPGAHGWSCWANDDTSKVAWSAGANTTTAVTLSGTIAVTSDKVVFGCMSY